MIPNSVTLENKNLCLIHEMKFLGNLPVVRKLDNPKDKLSFVDRLFRDYMVVELNKELYVVNRSSLQNHIYKDLKMPKCNLGNYTDYNEIIRCMGSEFDRLLTEKPHIQTILSEQKQEELFRELANALLTKKVDRVKSLILQGVSLNREFVIHEGYDAALSLGEFKESLSIDEDYQCFLHHCTPLLLAAQRGFTDLCELMIQSGADTKAVGYSTVFTRKIEKIHSLYTADKKLKEIQVDHQDKAQTISYLRLASDQKSLVVDRVTTE